jgi:regulator of sigma E protease
MIEVLRGAIAIVFLFSFAIFIHELGHFMFAKLFGVYVETFSIGFGKKIWRRQWGETEYAISLVPFGGYVKMKGMMSKEMEALLDEEKSSKDSKQKDPQENVVGPSHIATGEPAMEEVATIHIPHTPNKETGAGDKITNLSESVVDEMAALRTKPYFQRLLIFSAGCINNLLTAVFVFFMMNWIGHHRAEQTRPLIEQIEKPYAAMVPLQSGDRITKVGPQEVETYEEFFKEWEKQTKDKARNSSVEVTVLRAGNNQKVVLPVALEANAIPSGERIVSVGTKKVKNVRAAAEALKLEDFQENRAVSVSTVADGGKEQVRKVPAIAVAGYYWPSLALQLFGYPYVAMPVPNLPAEKAGIKPHDMIVAVNGKPVKSSGEATDLIRAMVGKTVPVQVERTTKGKKERVTVNVEVREDPDMKGRGQIGIAWGAPLTDHQKLAFLPALGSAFEQVGSMVLNYLRALKMLFSSSWKTIRENIGGPIAIGTQTYKAAQQGWLWFFSWMAMFNIVLAVTNLLPLPVLDGGHILFATIETIVRRPLPARAMMWMYNIFISMFLGLVVLITANDFIMNAWRLFN